jgi:hypothetical protein
LEDFDDAPVGAQVAGVQVGHCYCLVCGSLWKFKLVLIAENVGKNPINWTINCK